MEDMSFKMICLTEVCLMGGHAGWHIVLEDMSYEITCHRA